MELPPIKLDHLKALTDDTGVLQHAKYSTPRRRDGYTTDDNARALILCVKYHQVCNNSVLEKMISLYLSFLLHMQGTDGKFHNLMSYDRRFLDDIGSEDSMGRALWACGYTINYDKSEENKILAKEIFDNGFRWVSDFKSLRAKALAILGLQHYQKAFSEDKNLKTSILTLSDQLCSSFQDNSTSDWSWFEPYLTYSNARLPQALFEAYTSTEKASYLKIGEDSFTFLIENQLSNDKFVPFGNKGWYRKHEKKALYDQQPVEASCMVEAAALAFHVTGDEKYFKSAINTFDWFLGKNSQNIRVYDDRTGGCYDGITPNGLNLNQGAESTICYLLARLELENLFS